MIYLVTPTLETVNRILKDFADPKKPRYGDVHLFFLSKVCWFLLFWGTGLLFFLSRMCLLSVGCSP